MIKLQRYADVAELAASATKRSRWEMKRGEDGAAVKISRRSQPKEILGTARVARLRGVWGSSYVFKVSAAASVGASVLSTEVSPGHPHPRLSHHVECS